MSLKLCKLDETVFMKSWMRGAKGTVPRRSGTNHVFKYREAIVRRVYTSTSCTHTTENRDSV